MSQKIWYLFPTFLPIGLLWHWLYRKEPKIFFENYIFEIKAELLQEGILFCTQFPSLGIFINKKVGFRKN